jgi:hypothetical protein
MSPRMLNVREAMAAFLVNQGWSPEGAELMSWAVHPFERNSPPSTKALQKQVKRRADAVGQRAQELEEPQAVQLAVNALASYRQSALDDGNQPLARAWGDLLPAGAVPTGSTVPTTPTATSPATASTSTTTTPTEGWLHAVTLPPGRLAQLGSLDQPLEAVGRLAAQALTAHLVELGVGGEHAARCERAALAGYLIDLDLAGVAVTDVPHADDDLSGTGLDLTSVLAALAVLDAADLDDLARRHSPAADAVLTRLLAADNGTAVDADLVAGSLGAGLCLARVQRTGA